MAAASPAQDRPLRELRGVVERITYQNAENGFTVARLAPERLEAEAARGDDRLVTVVGTLADLTPGEAIVARGWWRNDSRHGWQFQATDYRTALPATLQGMKKYLGSGLVKGIGPIMSVLMPVTLLATLMAGALTYRRNRLAGLLVLAGFVCVAVATATMLIVNVPIDEVMAGWTASTLPADWTQIRDRWEAYHTARTFVTLGGLAVTLAGSLLPAGRIEAERCGATAPVAPDRGDWGRGRVRAFWSCTSRRPAHGSGSTSSWLS